MDRINTGDVDGALELIHYDVIIVEPSALPYGGTWTGHEGFRELFRNGIGATWRGWRERENRVAGVGDLVIRETTFTANLRSNGRTVEMPLLETFEFSQGKVAAIRPYYGDTGLYVAAAALERDESAL